MNDDYAHLPYDLNGHVALVTGANHGISAATAKALVSCGASVWNPRDTLPESEVNS